MDWLPVQAKKEGLLAEQDTLFTLSGNEIQLESRLVSSGDRLELFTLDYQPIDKIAIHTELLPDGSYHRSFPTKSRKPPATLSACNWSDIWPRWYRKTGKAAGKPLPPAGFSPYPLKRETLKSSQRSPGRHWTATPLRRSLPLQNRPCSAPGMYFGKPWIFLPFLKPGGENLCKLYFQHQGSLGYFSGFFKK